MKRIIIFMTSAFIISCSEIPKPDEPTDPIEEEIKLDIHGYWEYVLYEYKKEYFDPEANSGEGGWYMLEREEEEKEDGFGYYFYSDKFIYGDHYSDIERFKDGLIEVDGNSILIYKPYYVGGEEYHAFHYDYTYKIDKDNLFLVDTINRSNIMVGEKYYTDYRILYIDTYKKIDHSFLK